MIIVGIHPAIHILTIALTSQTTWAKCLAKITDIALWNASWCALEVDLNVHIGSNWNDIANNDDNILVIVAADMFFGCHNIGVWHGAITAHILIHPNVMRQCAAERIQLIFAIHHPITKERPLGIKAKRRVAWIEARVAVGSWIERLRGSVGNGEQFGGVIGIASSIPAKVNNVAVRPVWSKYRHWFNRDGQPCNRFDEVIRRNFIAQQGTTCRGGIAMDLIGRNIIITIVDRHFVGIHNPLQRWLVGATRAGCAQPIQNTFDYWRDAVSRRHLQDRAAWPNHGWVEGDLNTD